MWDECNFALPFFGTGMKTDLFQSCGHCWVFQIWWHIECSTFTASSLRIWNSSTGVPSPPLVLFVVILPKAHLTCSRLFGSRWVITPLWLSGSWRSFLYSSSMYSCHLFLISSASFTNGHMGNVTCTNCHMGKYTVYAAIVISVWKKIVTVIATKFLIIYWSQYLGSIE